MDRRPVINVFGICVGSPLDQNTKDLQQLFNVALIFVALLNLLDCYVQGRLLPLVRLIDIQRCG